MKIVIVDDDILVSSALKTILEAGGEVEVTGTGQDGKDAVRLYDELLPDVLLMDIRMKDMNGLDAAEQILKRHTDAKILLLTTFSDDEYIVKALKYGVKGYLDVYKRQGGCVALQCGHKESGGKNQTIRCQYSSTITGRKAAGLLFPVGTHGGFICFGYGIVSCRRDVYKRQYQHLTLRN